MSYYTLVIAEEQSPVSIEITSGVKFEIKIFDDEGCMKIYLSTSELKELRRFIDEHLIEAF